MLLAAERVNALETAQSSHKEEMEDGQEDYSLHLDSHSGIICGGVGNMIGVLYLFVSKNDTLL